MGPSAYRPDRSSALFTWAEDTGLSYSSGPSGRSGGSMRSGAVRSPARVGWGSPAMRAPRERSGPTTRIIGRFDSDASPMSVDANGCAESRPASRRMVVPELPQSRGAADARRPKRPLPCTTSSPSRGWSIVTPIARSALAVATLSSPPEKPWTLLWPEAIAPKSSARCPMLLSDGTGTLPTRGRVAG